MAMTKTRRDMLNFALAGAGLVASGAAAKGLLGALTPDASVGTRNVVVDLSKVAEGQTKFLTGPDGNYFVLWHRSPEMIARAERGYDGALRDPTARNANRAANAPATDANRRITADGSFVLYEGVCAACGAARFGFVLMQRGDGQGCKMRLGNDSVDDCASWYCVRCTARYDASGLLIAHGFIARNLPIPPVLVDGDRLVLLPRRDKQLSEEDLDALIYGVPES